MKIEKSAQFQKKLKEIYAKNDIIPQLIEGLDEIPAQSMKDYYVKLHTIIKEEDANKPGAYESVSGEKKEVEIAKIFDKVEGVADSKEANKLLLLGGAGVGKSTLMQYMAYKWGISEIWGDKFEYVYRITLKTLLTSDWKDRYDRSELNESELKCLTHYHLSIYLTKEEKKQLSLTDMLWPDNKSKVLLLLDGYDEVAHLRSTADYKEIFGEIFEHKNIILTSRPNAIDNQMREKFDRKIENTGLDNSGIEQYFRQYFKNDKEKGDGLQEFLEHHASIKDICKVPVNIAMLCYIWSEADSSDVLEEISGMSDLYQQVVQQLGFRYFAKWKYEGPEKSRKELKEIWKGGKVELDELAILKHTAYKSMTGGGVDVPDENRVETLMIKGMQTKGDKDGISIQSSINYLKNSLKELQITIEDIYKYGLLKTEGVQANEHNNKSKDVSDTNLQRQNYSFIHLTFQEYLTAYYFKNRLEQGQDQEKQDILQYIAEHRNEPRCLMILKFMAGIVTSDTSNAGNEITRMFWESVTCNVDGVIELGVETKVGLMMHLLSQAKIKGQLDERIPNKQQMTELIDIIVLRDLLEWEVLLKETDYITDNIKEGLTRALYEGKLDWNIRKISEILQQSSSTELKRAVSNMLEGYESLAKAEQSEELTNAITKRAIKMAGSLISKFSADEKLKFASKLSSIIKDNTNWELTKQSIETLTRIAPYVQISVEETKELLDKLVSLMTDSNFTDSAAKAISALIKESPEMEILASTTLEHALKLFNDESWIVRRDVANCAIELAKTDASLLATTLEAVLKLFNDQDSDVRRAAVNGATELAKNITDATLLTKAFEAVLKRFNDSNDNVRQNAVNGAIELAKNITDATLLTKAFEAVLKRFNDRDDNVRDAAVKVATEPVVNFLVPIETFSSSLHHINKEFRDSIICSLSKSFKDLLDKLELLNELLEDSENLTISIINEKLFGKKMNKSLQEKVEAELAKIKESKDLNPLKELLIHEINRIGNKSSYELIEPALIAIDEEGADKSIKELTAMAKKLINYQLAQLGGNEEGLKWVNSNFKRLAASSKDSKNVFLKKLYHKILEDLEITELDQELIIKFINEGLTTSITRKGEIVFEGRKYKISGQNIELILDGIAKAVLDQENDVLAIQYKEHKPIFRKSDKLGAKNASSDVESITSIVDKNLKLTDESWILSSMSLKGKEITLLEKRNALGDYVIYQLKEGSGLVKIDIKSLDAKSIDGLRETIFGKYEYSAEKQLYYGKLARSLKLEDGNKILLSKGQELEIIRELLSSTENVVEQREFFHDELLNIGQNDRIFAELNKKLTDGEKKLDGDLQMLKLSQDDIIKIKDYYKAFVGTIAAAYTCNS